MHFNWAITERPLIIFIPNYGRGNYIRSTIKQFYTGADKNKYAIIIGNDGIDENFDDLAADNVYWFTLNRTNHTPRNGCFIRNYFIKRCKSQYLLQKDPETIILDTKNEDWLYRYSNLSLHYTFLRPGFTQSLNNKITNDIMNGVDPLVFLRPEHVDPHQHYRVHWAFLTQTNLLQQCRGYDEEYTTYGPEDADLYYRLGYAGLPIMTDNSLVVMHMDHPMDVTALNEQHEKMIQLYKSKDPYKTVRNDDNWGNG